VATDTGSEQAVVGAEDGKRPPQRSSARTWLELIIVGTAALCCSLSQSLLIPVQQPMRERLAADPSTFGWLFTATLLVAAVSVPLLGRLGDMFGTRLMLLASVAMLTLGSLVCALTDDIAVMITGRALQGFALAAIPLGISLLSALLPPDKVGTGIAVVSAMLGVGGALAMPLGGWIGQHADHHWLFWITVITGAASFAAIALVVPEAPDRTRGRVDVLGALLLSAALVCLLLPVAKSADWGCTGPRPLALFGGSLVLFLVLGLTQTRVRNPLIDLAALRHRPIVLTNVASVLYGFALFAMFLGTAPYLQAPEGTGYGFGLSVVASGLCMLPSGVMMLLLSSTAARLIRRLGAPNALALGALIVALGWLSRLLLDEELWQVVTGSTVIGVGVSLGFAALPTLVNEHTPATERSAANGLNSLARSLGTSLSSAVSSGVLASHTLSGRLAGLPTLGAYRIVFVACGSSAVLAALLALAIRRREPRAGR